MSVRVRPATAADYPAVARAALEVLEHHAAVVPDVFQRAAVALPEEYFAELLTDADSGVLVAERDGAIVGYAVLQLRRTSLAVHVPRIVAYVQNFGVSQSVRRGGVGRALLEACAAWGRAHGAGSLELDCWEANRAAIAFYTTQGMRVTRRYFALDL